MGLSKNESIKYVRKCARNVGLTFKKSTTGFNGAYLYKLTCRKTGETVMSDYLFSSAFNDACSGYIESWNGYSFTGI